MPDPDDEDLERLLRNAQPTPRPGYTRELEGSLALPAPKASGRTRLVVAGVSVIVALAVLTLVASLAGWLG